MMKVEILYNPYYLRTQIKVEGKVIGNTYYSKIKEKIDAKIPIQAWMDRSASDPGWKGLLEELVQETGEVNIHFKLTGRKIDCEDLKKSIEQQNESHKYCIEFEEDIIYDDAKLSDDIETVVKRMLEPDFKEMVEDDSLSTSQLKEKYGELEEQYNAYKNKEFRIVFSGLMSSGKSTLINAIVGKRILPTAINTCTSRVLKIMHRNDEKIYLRCLDKEGGVAVDRVKCSSEDEVMGKLKEICPQNNDYKTNPENVETIEVEMNLGHLYPIADWQKQFKIVLVDTPGTDSGVGNAISEGRTHKEITLDAICNQDKEMVVFVNNVEKYEDESVLSFFDAVEEQSREQENIGYNDRFLFLLNRCDAILYNDDESLERTIEKYSKYLCKTKNGSERKILSPRIFPVCALPALAVKKELTDENQSPAGLLNIADAYTNFHKKCLRGDSYSDNYKLDKYAALPEHQREELEKEYSGKGEIGQALLHTGIPSLEYAIKNYIERYAYPMKVCELLDTFESILTQLETVIDAQQKTLDEQIEKIKKAEDEKKGDEERKAGEDEYNFTLSEVDKKIAVLLKEAEEIKPDINAVRELRTESDESIHKVMLICGKDYFLTRNAAERAIEDACVIINTTIEKINEKYEEIKSNALCRQKEIIFELQEIKNRLECLPEIDREWLKNSVAGKKLLKIDTIDDLKSKIEQKSETIWSGNPEKYIHYSLWQFIKMLKQMLAPRWIRKEENRYFNEEFKTTIENMQVKIPLFLDGLMKRLESIDDMSKYIAKCIDTIKSELEEHRSKAEEFAKKVKAAENNIAELEEIRRPLKEKQDQVKNISDSIKEIIKTKEEE